MRTQAFWKTVTMDDSDLVHDLVSLLDENGARYAHADAPLLLRPHIKRVQVVLISKV